MKKVASFKHVKVGIWIIKKMKNIFMNTNRDIYEIVE